MKMNGKYRVQHIRGDQTLSEQICNNFVTTQGRNHILNTIFKTAETTLTVWFLGLISNTPAPTLSEADTGASHAGWTEFDDYSGGERLDFTSGTVASSAIATNSGDEAEFTMTAGGQIYGVFLCSESDLASDPDLLFSEVAFTSYISVTTGDIIKVTYELELD